MEALVPGPPQTSQIRVGANAAGLPGVTCCSQQVRGWRLPLETHAPRPVTHGRGGCCYFKRPFFSLCLPIVMLVGISSEVQKLPLGWPAAAPCHTCHHGQMCRTFAQDSCWESGSRPRMSPRCSRAQSPREAGHQVPVGSWGGPSTPASDKLHFQFRSRGLSFEQGSPGRGGTG